MENVVAEVRSILDVSHLNNVDKTIQGFYAKANKTTQETGSRFNKDYILFAFIRRAFTYMAYVALSQLPKNKGASLRTNLSIVIHEGEPNEEDIFVPLELVKMLDDQGIYELRVSLGDRKIKDAYVASLFKGSRHFRSIFIPYINRDKQLYYCFVYAYEKKTAFRDRRGREVDPFTDQYIEKTKPILQKSMDDPEGFEKEYMI